MKIMFTKNLYANVYCNSIHGHENLETIQMAFKRQMNKWTVVNNANKTLLSNKKKQSIDIYNNLDAFQKHYAKEKKPVSKGYTLYDYIYMTLSKR